MSSCVGYDSFGLLRYLVLFLGLACVVVGGGGDGKIAGMRIVGKGINGMGKGVGERLAVRDE